MAPRRSPFAITAAVFAALGVCALGASVMSPVGLAPPWALAAGGTALLVSSLVLLWRIQRRRDRSLW